MQAETSSVGDAEASRDHGRSEASTSVRRLPRLVALRSFIRHLTLPPLSVSEGVAGLLEVMDRPARRLGPGARQAIGWLAIATLGTSLIVFLVSLF